MSHASGVIYSVSLDELSRIDLEFEDRDLSIYSSITLRMRRSDGILVTQPAVIDDAPGGLCHFDWSPGDIIAGLHELEFRFIASGKAETFPKQAPLRVVVREQV
jgi:hypothetical protein